MILLRHCRNTIRFHPIEARIPYASMTSAQFSRDVSVNHAPESKTASPTIGG